MTVHMSVNMLSVINGGGTFWHSATLCSREFYTPDIGLVVVAEEATGPNFARKLHFRGGLTKGRVNDAWKLVDCPECIIAMDTEE
jgi:hypothetical protein